MVYSKCIIRATCLTWWNPGITGAKERLLTKKSRALKYFYLSKSNQKFMKFKEKITYYSESQTGDVVAYNNLV